MYVFLKNNKLLKILLLSVYLVDISDLSNPKELSNQDANGYSVEKVLYSESNKYFFAACRNFGVIIYKISDDLATISKVSLIKTDGGEDMLNPV